MVATLSSDGERENRGDPMLSASGLKALRKLDGLRFLACAPEREDMLLRFRGTLSCMLGGDAMLADLTPRDRNYGGDYEECRYGRRCAFKLLLTGKYQ